MIEARELVKVFSDDARGEVVAVDRVSFTASEGRIFGVLGPNGAGKTTTLRLISTVLAPTGGTALVNGYDIRTQPSEVRKQIGFLSGDTGLYARLTPVEMVSYFGRLHGMSEDPLRRRIEEVFDMLGLNEYRDTRNDHLSKGNQQKVSIARTIIHDPPVFVFDEPTAGLDVIVARAVLDFIDSCRQMGKCILFSTHIMQEAERLCDDIGIIHRGKLLAIGSAQELASRAPSGRLEDAFVQLVEAEEDVAQGVPGIEETGAQA